MQDKLINPRHFYSTLTAVVIILPCVVLLGWQFNNEALKTVLPFTSAMNPFAAVLFIFCGISLYLIGENNSDQLKYFGKIISLGILIISILLLGGILHLYDCRIDQLLFTNNLAGSKVAPNTIICFLLVSFSLLIVDHKNKRKYNFSQIVSLIAFLIGLLAVIGYIYKSRSFYRIDLYTPMALHTALTFCALSMAIIISRYKTGFISVVFHKNTGGVIIRRLLPFAIVIPVIISWLKLEGSELNLYDAEFGSALGATGIILTFSLIIWWIAASLNNVGALYKSLGDIPKALDYYHNCLKIQESIKNKNGIAYALSNIGDVYNDQGEPNKALEYYNKSLVIWKEINDKSGVARALDNIGSMYNAQGDYDNALTFCENGLKLRKEADDKQGIIESLKNIGYIYLKQKNYIVASDFFQKSLILSEEINDKQGICYALSSLIKVKIMLSEYKEVLPFAERNFKLSQELGFPHNIKTASNLLSNIYSKTGNYKGAYEMQVLYKQMTDSINNEVNKKASIQKGFQYEYEKKATADSVKTVAERRVLNVQIKQERTQRIALYIGIGLFALFSIFMYNRFRITSKQKHIIELQKKEVDIQRELADSRRHLAEEQKEIIAEKQKEILDSIHYAKRIQQAMLTSESYFDEHLNAEYFIYYQPKDIVSGDFYWAVEHHNKFYIATADCTGHGVPGAFMSLLNISFLNENVIERNLKDPGQILNEQRKEIIKALNPKGSENSKDGMDCVLCAIDIKNNILEFAAANNPVWLIRNHEIIEYKADKMPVGKYEDNAKDFKSQSIVLQKGDLIYTFTDGYADQFGGPKGKKFKYKQLENLLLFNHHLPMNQQRELLSQTINDWKGSNEQVDDILVIGVRI